MGINESVYNSKKYSNFFASYVLRNESPYVLETSTFWKHHVVPCMRLALEGRGSHFWGKTSLIVVAHSRTMDDRRPADKPLRAVQA